MAKSTKLADVPDAVLLAQSPLEEILVTEQDTLEVEAAGVGAPSVVVSDDSGMLPPADEELAAVELAPDDGEIDFSMFGFGVISVSEDAEIVVGGADSFVTFDPLDANQYVEDFII
ncbi:MAG: hypothetical protein ACR2OJ_14245 [Hyphomicrobiales bacterium]